MSYKTSTEPEIILTIFKMIMELIENRNVLKATIELIKDIESLIEETKQEFPDIDFKVETETFPLKIIIIYDFLSLSKDKRYKLFDFERKLISDMERIFSEYIGESINIPIEVEFVRTFKHR